MLDVGKLTLISSKVDASTAAVTVEVVHKTPSQCDSVSLPRGAVDGWRVVADQLMSSNVVKFTRRQTFHFKHTNQLLNGVLACRICNKMMTVTIGAVGPSRDVACA